MMARSQVQDIFKAALAIGFLAAVFLSLPACSEKEKAEDEGPKITRKLRKEWPRTDFDTFEIPFLEFTPAGPRKNEVPQINRPEFRSASPEDAGNLEPVISVTFGGEARAYPISIMLWHEVVNDTVGGVAIAVTFSPLTNAVRVFERKVNGEVTTFGTSGLLRKAGQVIYDESTQSWWQQYIGTALFGASTGATMEVLPVRLESMAAFVARHPGGDILVPNTKGRRPYGRTPFPGYERAKVAVHYKGDYRRSLPPMTRLVVVGNEAWTMDFVQNAKTIETSDLRIEFSPGMNSAYDTTEIRQGRDTGYVSVQRKLDNVWVDAVYDTPFAFAFDAFHPGHPIHH